MADQEAITASVQPTHLATKKIDDLKLAKDFATLPLEMAQKFSGYVLADFAKRYPLIGTAIISNQFTRARLWEHYVATKLSRPLIRAKFFAQLNATVARNFSGQVLSEYACQSRVVAQAIASNRNTLTQLWDYVASKEILIKNYNHDFVPVVQANEQTKLMQLCRHIATAAPIKQLQYPQQLGITNPWVKARLDLTALDKRGGNIVAYLKADDGIPSLIKQLIVAADPELLNRVLKEEWHKKSFWQRTWIGDYSHEEKRAVARQFPFLGLQLLRDREHPLSTDDLLLRACKQINKAHAVGNITTLKAQGSLLQIMASSPALASTILRESAATLFGINTSSLLTLFTPIAVISTPATQASAATLAELFADTKHPEYREALSSIFSQPTYAQFYCNQILSTQPHAAILELLQFTFKALSPAEQLQQLSKFLDLQTHKVFPGYEAFVAKYITEHSKELANYIAERGQSDEAVRSLKELQALFVQAETPVQSDAPAVAATVLAEAHQMKPAEVKPSLAAMPLASESVDKLEPPTAVVATISAAPAVADSSAIPVAPSLDNTTDAPPAPPVPDMAPATPIKRPVDERKQSGAVVGGDLFAEMRKKLAERNKLSNGDIENKVADNKATSRSPKIPNSLMTKSGDGDLMAALKERLRDRRINIADDETEVAVKKVTATVDKAQLSAIPSAKLGTSTGVAAAAEISTASALPAVSLAQPLKQATGVSAAPTLTVDAAVPIPPPLPDFAEIPAAPAVPNIVNKKHLSTGASKPSDKQAASSSDMLAEMQKRHKERSERLSQGAKPQITTIKPQNTQQLRATAHFSTSVGNTFLGEMQKRQKELQARQGTQKPIAPKELARGLPSKDATQKPFAAPGLGIGSKFRLQGNKEHSPMRVTPSIPRFN